MGYRFRPGAGGADGSGAPARGPSPVSTGDTGRSAGAGRDPLRVSLLAGCHADEPTGPRLLRRLAGYLADLPDGDPLRSGVEWWIVPDANPDGAARNRVWHSGEAAIYDLAAYLRGVEREPPGDDVEFGFPRGPDDSGARPENRALRRWWREAGAPFHLHASLHGMAAGIGAWFLLEPAWRERTVRLREICRRRAGALGYGLHDDPRRGDKGFHRIERGFSTRPDSRAMQAHFRERGEGEKASRFRPSSMEAVRSLGGDPLCVVTEAPLFVGPPLRDPSEVLYGGWKDRLTGWGRALRSGETPPGEVRARAAELGLRAVPLRDQMDLQWTLVAAGLEAVVEEREEGDGAS